MLLCEVSQIDHRSTSSKHEILRMAKYVAWNIAVLVVGGHISHDEVSDMKHHNTSSIRSDTSHSEVSDYQASQHQ